MKRLLQLKLTECFSSNNLFTLIASILFGSFAFATSEVQIKQSLPSSYYSDAITKIDQPAEAPSKRVYNKRDGEVRPLLNSTADAKELTISTLPQEKSEVTAEHTLILVLLSVLGGEH